jgi:hypothetical protein
LIKYTLIELKTSIMTCNIDLNWTWNPQKTFQKWFSLQLMEKGNF